MGSFRRRQRRVGSGRVGLITRLIALVSALLLAGVLATSSASAITFSTTGSGAIAPVTSTSCPTISTPAPFETWTNIPDLESRGFWDPNVQQPWDVLTKTAQVICGAAPGSTIKIGMYFIRAIGTMTSTGYGIRPETDPEQVWRALEWVKKNRKVTIGIVLDNSADIATAVAKKQVSQRLRNIGSVYYCSYGCFNLNAGWVHPDAINHEKFVSITNTTWPNSSKGPHPVVLSMSANFARSQVRLYQQEITLIYDDKTLAKLFDIRYDGMVNCARTGCKSAKGFPSSLQLSKQGNIWVDPFYRHYTDAGRGTTVSFAPQASTASDFYIRQFDDVDCTVDRKIRIAMFKLTDARAQQMVSSLVRLKKRGCDIQMLLTYQGGRFTLSPAVAKLLRTSRIPVRCTQVAMHTKMILIGPMHNNNGRVLMGTQNMSVPGLRYNEEHVITLDVRRATGRFVEPMRRVYGQYLSDWYEFSKSTRSCT
ncbi:phospholipase D-like domain-containing protein [Microlunatus ginsengisoli]|uniref:phospholipase D n=1 Tax=Microlunatus ginsengisoli TaxID=363863 RepID=A0ABP7AML7_9ACTN